MLTDLLEVSERVSLTLHDCRHTTERSTFKLFATVEGICEFQKTGVILCDGINQVLCSVDLTESELVMISVVQHIHQIRVEGMDFLTG